MIDTPEPGATGVTIRRHGEKTLLVIQLKPFISGLHSRRERHRRQPGIDVVNKRPRTSGIVGNHGNGGLGGVGTSNSQGRVFRGVGGRTRIPSVLWCKARRADGDRPDERLCRLALHVRPGSQARKSPGVGGTAVYVRPGSRTRKSPPGSERLQETVPRRRSPVTGRGRKGGARESRRHSRVCFRPARDLGGPGAACLVLRPETVLRSRVDPRHLPTPPS